MAIMTSDAFSMEFTTTQLRRVYDDNEVDEFLDQIVVELRRLTTDNDELRALIPPDALDKVAAARASAENIEKDAAARIAKANAEAEAAEAGAAERARSATEGADEIANSAVTAGARAADEIGGAPAAAGLLALAQKLHDEYVSEGKAKHDALIAEADELLASCWRRPMSSVSTSSPRRGSVPPEWSPRPSRRGPRCFRRSVMNVACCRRRLKS